MSSSRYVSRLLPTESFTIFVSIRQPVVSPQAMTLSLSYLNVSQISSNASIYTEIPFSPTMTGIIVKILIDVLSVLALATKQIKLGRFSK